MLIKTADNTIVLFSYLNINIKDCHVANEYTHNTDGYLSIIPIDIIHNIQC